QLLAEIDPVLADTALTSANATLENMTSQRSVKQAQLALAKAQRARNEKLFEEGIISASDRDITRANYDLRCRFRRGRFALGADEGSDGGGRHRLSQAAVSQ